MTVAQLLTRDDFAKRYAAETPIFLHECLYPMMQAWDSVKIAPTSNSAAPSSFTASCWPATCRRDQGLPPQIGVMSPILVGLDGVRRMGKSLGNYIGISESPYEMMKKFMQLPDGVMQMYFELLTDIPLAEVDAAARRASEGGEGAAGEDGHRPVPRRGIAAPKPPTAGSARSARGECPTTSRT